MSHPAAAYTANQPGALPGALATAPYQPLTKAPEATWSEALLGQECGIWLQRTYPLAYAVFFHIPNGGLRTAVEAVSFKGQHAKAGVPDYFLATGGQGYGGLFIELKTPKGRVAPEQAAWHTRLRQQGYRVEVVRSLAEFQSLLTEYLA